MKVELTNGCNRPTCSRTSLVRPYAATRWRHVVSWQSASGKFAAARCLKRIESVTVGSLNKVDYIQLISCEIEPPEGVHGYLYTFCTISVKNMNNFS